MRTVAALFVDPKGPYTQIEGVDCWDEQRDALRYPGPFPVGAHPPCGPWGRLKFLCRHQRPDGGLFAVDAVREFGGVLEHPEHSTLWKATRLPMPGELPDAHGGFSVAVRQSDWGHRCAKPTWLYCVGVDRSTVENAARANAGRGVATHRITNGSRGDTTLPRVGSIEARLTPVPFALWLVDIARSVGL